MAFEPESDDEDELELLEDESVLDEPEFDESELDEEEPELEPLDEPEFPPSPSDFLVLKSVSYQPVPFN